MKEANVDSVDEILRLSPNAEIIFSGDFNVHHVLWLQFSNRMDASGLAAESFVVLNDLTQLVDQPTHIPDNDDQQPHLFDHFMTSDLEKYYAAVNPSMGKSDHCLVSTSFALNIFTSATDKVPKSVVWHYKNGQWN